MRYQIFVLQKKTAHNVTKKYKRIFQPMNSSKEFLNKMEKNNISLSQYRIFLITRCVQMHDT